MHPHPFILYAKIICNNCYIIPCWTQRNVQSARKQRDPGTGREWAPAVGQAGRHGHRVKATRFQVNPARDICTTEAQRGTVLDSEIDPSRVLFSVPRRCIFVCGNEGDRARLSCSERSPVPCTLRRHRARSKNFSLGQLRRRGMFIEPRAMQRSQLRRSALFIASSGKDRASSRGATCL